MSFYNSFSPSYKLSKHESIWYWYTTELQTSWNHYDFVAVGEFLVSLDAFSGYKCLGYLYVSIKLIWADYMVVKHLNWARVALLINQFSYLFILGLYSVEIELFSVLNQNPYHKPLCFKKYQTCCCQKCSLKPICFKKQPSFPF